MIRIAWGMYRIIQPHMVFVCVCVCASTIYFLLHYLMNSGFGGLVGACWPLVPKFAASNPAEAVGFLGRKNPQHAFLLRGSKVVGPLS